MLLAESGYTVTTVTVTAAAALAALALHWHWPQWQPVTRVTHTHKASLRDKYLLLVQVLTPPLAGAAVTVRRR